MQWEDIKTKRDASELIKNLGFFHDGCFRELHVWSGTYISEKGLLMNADAGLKAKILIHSSGFMGIDVVEMMFTDIKRINVPENDPKFSHHIHGSTLKYKDRVFYWADTDDWDVDEPRNHEVLWIAAKGLKWREKPGWLGKTLRYGIDD